MKKGIRQNNVVGTEVLYKDPVKLTRLEAEGGEAGSGRLKIITMESLILAQDER